MAKRIAIAIDGPAGAGKSTMAKLLAERLGYVYVDTGAMYRAVTLYMLEQGISPAAEAAVCAALPAIRLDLTHTSQGDRIAVNDTDVTAAIRTPEVSAAVSQVSSYACVRAFLVKRQREWGAAGGIVMDGRDIGTVVLPEAELKIFLTASVRVRALRRLAQWQQEYPDRPQELAAVEEGIRARDRADSEREISPLRQAEDAVLVNTDELTPEETLARLLALAKKVTTC